MAAPTDVQARLAELAKLPPAARPVVSVYLNTRWTDEDQRQRVRIFLKNHLREAREAAERPAEEDLAWIEAEGQRLIDQVELTDASGVALIAGGPGLREVLPVRAAFEDTFVVASTPYLRPLAGVAQDVVPALVVFVDGVSARLTALTPSGPGEELTLESEVPPRTSAGGWAALAQTKYTRHIEMHREQHFEATAAAIAALVERHDVRRIVLAGEVRAVANLRHHLSDPLGRRVVGVVAAARHETSAVIATRAADYLARLDEQEDADAVDRMLDAAAKGGRAVAGMESTLEAVNRNAVQHLYLARDFQRPGATCERCLALQLPVSGACRFCGAATQPTELGEAMTTRVLASGGEVSVLGRHAALDGLDGVGALLRYMAA
jgi:peptide subunit release factor 1 (eRF1)